MSITRRELITSAAAAAAAGFVMQSEAHPAAEIQATPRGPGGPLVISSENGVNACKRAMELLKAGGDPVDAVVAGVNLVEDDPEDHSVGYGGLPNEDGVVELDACVMHGPTHKAGAVAALQNIRNPSSVARVVMQRTDHVLLVGAGALRFAKAHGFKEEDLLTDEARRMWLEWKENQSDTDDWLPPQDAASASARHQPDNRKFHYGTITCMALTASGDLGGCTTTSGLSYKIAGRVGDSPIIGAGLYVDNAVGTCGSTGRGEANLVNCSSFLVVELMKRGATPEEACRQVLQGIAERTERRLRDGDGRPDYGLKLYAIRKDGLVGGASMRGQGRLAVHDESECRLIDMPGLFPAKPKD
jgi:N4-(beta-N-acetylglucosaminyl)-L-asparaginase